MNSAAPNPPRSEAPGCTRPPCIRASYSSRTKGQDREANLTLCLADYPRHVSSRRRGHRQLGVERSRSAIFYSGPERSGVRRLAICHAAFHVGAYATGIAAVNPAHSWAADRRRIHQIRSLKFHARYQPASKARGYGANRFKPFQVVVSFTGLSVFHDRNHERRRFEHVRISRGEFRNE